MTTKIWTGAGDWTPEDYTKISTGNSLNLLQVNPNDDFTTLDETNKYSSANADAGTYGVSGGTLNLSSGIGVGSTIGGVNTRFGMSTGDYSVQIDFSSLAYGTSANEAQPARLEAYGNGGDDYTMLFMNVTPNTAGTKRVQSMIKTNGGGWATTTFNSAVSSGSLKITFTKGTNTITTNYNVGAGWVELDSVVGATHDAPTKFIIRCASDGNTAAATSKVDDLVFTGTMSNGYYQDNPEFVLSKIRGWGMVDVSSGNHSTQGTGSDRHTCKHPPDQKEWGAWMTDAAFLAHADAKCTNGYEHKVRVVSDGTQTYRCNSISFKHTLKDYPRGGRAHHKCSMTNVH